MRIGKLILPLLLLVSACTTVKVGREFDLAAFDAKVQRGVNGTGVSVDTGGERYEDWNYYYGTVRIPGSADSHVKLLQIKFDQRGVVRGYNWSGERG